MHGSSGASLVAAGMVINFIMTFVMLWASAEVVGRSRTRRRLALGAATATAFLAVTLLLVGSGIMGFRSIFTVLFALASVPASVAASFAPLRLGDLVRLSVLSLFFTGLAAGTTVAVNLYTGGWMVGTGWDMVTSLIIAVGSVLLVAELGWGIVHRRMRESLYSYLYASRSATSNSRPMPS